MARIVLDTNTHISGVLSRKPGSVRNALSNAYLHHDIFQSPETFAELREVLMRPKFDRFLSQQDRLVFLDEVAHLSEFVHAEPVVGVSPDPKDDKFFALAAAVQADYLISGDVKDVLSVSEYRGTLTISPVDFSSGKKPSLAFAQYGRYKKSQAGILVPEILDLS